MHLTHAKWASGQAASWTIAWSPSLDRHMGTTYTPAWITVPCGETRVTEREKGYVEVNAVLCQTSRNTKRITEVGVVIKGG